MNDRKQARKKFRAKNRRVTDQRAADRIDRFASRNAGSPRGRAVPVGDVAAHALSGHSKCRGTGMLGARMACACATRRFLKAHPDVIVVPDGAECGVYYPVKIEIEKEADDE